ncbi:DUF3991 domain-containing protein [Bradyrhizobium diazoefficiens]|uniref:DUF3991 and toprim domain-containing protein n=1 Tax=Bradyrhizobium diazoefficiens TaxID=1355477 RepID=UPI00190E4364|nr:DUF3991 and toprim domain-containing protein [Bradyrhizobium diazoefficiens]MBK3666382.1 DUF3991 domain-containing protein [Bradyrhizobium diazoefficiens]
MEKKDIEELKNRVACAAVLEKAGFAIDLKESTRKAAKYRRGGDIIIVIHQGRGWFDALSDARGDVFSLVEHLDGINFPEVLQRVSDLVGFVPTEPVWTREARAYDPDLGAADRWRSRRRPWRDSLTWRYLREERGIPEAVIGAAIRHDRLREGPHGSMWAAHLDNDGRVMGWEERGPQWRGFATGGGKVLFRFGPANATRLCVTEAAIDAMSLAAIEDQRPDSLYLSTGGGWAPATVAAIRALSARPAARLVAATDNNRQGEVYADRLAAIAQEVGCDYERLRPAPEDWNEQLHPSSKRKKEREEKANPAAACPPSASRVKLRPRAAALDPADRRGGRGGGVRKG